MFYWIQTGEVMWLLLILLNIIGNNSWFGEFNSRLGLANSRFGRLREFAGNSLIWLAGFADKRRFYGENRGNSRFDGNNREFCAFPIGR
jgi:hypothetical protein